MDRGTDDEVLGDAVRWLRGGARVFLVTVTRTWGSSPRRPGALMAIHADGRFTGSVSGGCVEDELVQRVLKGEFDAGGPRRLVFGVTREATASVGLPCGGRLEVLLECIESPAQLASVLRTIEARQRIARRVCLNTGETSLHAATIDSDLSIDDNNLVRVFGPRWRLLIIGAGELSRRVAQLAMTLDYAVTLCDPRPEYAAGWHVDGTEFAASPVAQTIARFGPDARSAVLALSHTPALDDAALLAALQSDAFYVGALGSTSNQRTRRERLRRSGLSAAQLERLQGPVGLDIGSRTPAEIAVAVAAALVLERQRQAQRLPGVQTAHG
ncbi:MAG: XdhC family protein [Thiogranum sp.]|nr:XdhC family protein [Thiogranum sp.]